MDESGWGEGGGRAMGGAACQCVGGVGGIVEGGDLDGELVAALAEEQIVEAVCRLADQDEHLRAIACRVRRMGRREVRIERVRTLCSSRGS